MDPLGFAFEHFDAVSAFRDSDESALPIDASSDVNGAPVDGGMALGELVAVMPEVGACIARRFYEHAGAHLAGTGDEASVQAVVKDFTEHDYMFKELVLALVASDGYRLAAAPSAATEVKP